MTSQEKDKFICEKLGVCWHEVITKPCSFGYLHRCSCGTLAPDGNIYIDRDSHKNPDFTSKAGRVQLLKMIVKKYGWVKLIQRYENAISVVLDIGDDTGRFRDEVFKWLRGEKR